MALKRNERYPGRFENPSDSHPQGAFKNRTSPSAQDGSYFESDWANDWSGFFEALLTNAGVRANGNVDSATSSQYYDSLLKATPGRLSRIVTFSSSGTYTPPAGVTRIKVTITGAGGGGAGCQASSTAQTFSGSGGGAGGTAIALLNPLASSYVVTVGTGGKGGVGAASGANGGNTSFGALLANGGLGAYKVGATNTSGGEGGAATGGDVNIRGGDGSDGQTGTYLITGNGGASYHGGGGRAGNAVGLGGRTPGSGGGGAYDVATTGKSYTGGTGANGIVIIEEYS